MAEEARDISLPDVSTAAEAGQPLEPEVAETVETEVLEETFAVNDDIYPPHVRFEEKAQESSKQVVMSSKN